MSKVLNSIKGLPGYVKQHWNTTNPGEYLTLREVTFYTLGSMGINGVLQLFYLVTFSADYLCGSIFGIAVKDFYVIGIVGTVIGYITFVMRPIDILIFENHGHIAKKPAIFGFTFWTVMLVIGIGCYFVPSAPFEHIMKGLPQIVANILVTGAVGFYLNWFIRYKFSAKYGRQKPFMIIYSVPAIVLLAVIPWLPVDKMSYTSKLIVLHLAFTFMSMFSGPFLNYQGLVQFMSPNSVERQKLLSYCALPIGILSSLYSMLLPVLIIPTGGYLNIWSYRIFIPILGFIGLLLSFCLIPVKERIIEDPQDRPKVKFFDAAKKVFKDKYLWITSFSTVFGQWGTIANPVMNYFFIYALRQEWLLGFAGALVSFISSNIPKLIVPTLIKKHEKRSIMIVSRICSIVFLVGYFLAISMKSVVLLILFNMGRNFFNQIYNQISLGINADIMDYHQWKTGERADSSSTVIGWITGPITMVVGYIFPAVLAYFGFTSDWDTLYDSHQFKVIMLLYVIFTVLGWILSTVPFCFYDLTKEKHEMCIREMEERLAEKQASEKNGSDGEAETDADTAQKNEPEIIEEA